MSTYVIIDRQGKFFAQSILQPNGGWNSKWVKEYPDALLFTSEDWARAVWRALTPLMTKIVADYGLATEYTL